MPTSGGSQLSVIPATWDLIPLSSLLWAPACGKQEKTQEVANTARGGDRAVWPRVKEFWDLPGTEKDKVLF